MLTKWGKTYSTHLDTTRSLIDQLVVAGKHVDDQNLINFLLINLQSSYTPFVTSFNFASQDTEFTFEDFQTEFIGFENVLKINQLLLQIMTTLFLLHVNQNYQPL